MKFLKAIGIAAVMVAGTASLYVLFSYGLYPAPLHTHPDFGGPGISAAWQSEKSQEPAMDPVAEGKAIDDIFAMLSEPYSMIITGGKIHLDRKERKITIADKTYPYAHVIIQDGVQYVFRHGETGEIFRIIALKGGLQPLARSDRIPKSILEHGHDQK